MSHPTFSIVITTYNRARIVCRCIDACLAQSFADFEIVVVDDGSADDTAAVLAERYDDPRLRLIAHEANRGINPSRHTGVADAKGEWVVVVDSDDELLPEALERLRELIGELPEGVRVLRSRQIHDDGHVTPSFVPDGPYGYEDRIRWATTPPAACSAPSLPRAPTSTAGAARWRRSSS
jgi:glycosyltransferase involved in cell wall biosynthesis